MSVFDHKTVFTPEQAACLLAGVTAPKENYAEVGMWEEEIELAFPPKREMVLVDGYAGGYRAEKVTPATITREQLIRWCEQKGISPPALFPEPDEPDPREITSLIRLVAVLLKQARDPKSSGNGTPKAIKMDAQFLGIQLSAPTISKWLKEAEKLLPPVTK